MRHSPCMLAAGGFPGFWRRSLDHFKNQTNVGKELPLLFQRAAADTHTKALKLETLHRVKPSLTIWDFSTPESVQTCVDMSDTDIGGQSSAQLEFVPAAADEPAHARFSGLISNALPDDDDNGKVQRTGYAAWRTEARPPTVFGRQVWDVDNYRYLALRVKADARKYKINLQTDSVEVTDLHQHRLYARSPGRWETVLVRWQDFVRTNHGVIVEPQSEMLKDQLRTVGLGLTDRLPGRFELCVSRIWATNNDDVSVAPNLSPKHMRLSLGAGPKRVESYN